MAKFNSHIAGTLLKTSGWSAVAAALALMAIPSIASAQERGGRGGGQSAQSQSGGGGNPGRSWGGGNRGGDGGGRSWGGGNAARQQSPQTVQRAVRSDGGQSNRWNNRSVTNDGGAWRAQQGERMRAQEAQRSQQNTDAANRQRIESAQRVQADRAMRQVERSERQDRIRSGQGQQWSGRNGTYGDPNRNRSYTDGRRDNDNRNWNNRNADNRNWRDNNDRDGNRWANSNRWNNNGNRWSGNSNNNRWDRDWRRNNRYDWQGYRSSNRDVYRLGRYYAPYRNYSYRRVGIGFQLGSLFYGSRYLIDDPWYYRLPPAYGSYRWVRYYDDALLVDVYSGEVIDVIENFFW